MNLLAPETIDVAVLPSADLEDVKSLPKESGLYFVYAQDPFEVVYIGVSVSIHKRIVSHQRKQASTCFYQPRVAWILMPYKELAFFEETCIAFFKPLLNSAKGGSLGPVPRGFINVHVMLPPDLIEWAKEQPEGLSGIARQAMNQEKRRRKVAP